MATVQLAKVLHDLGTNSVRELFRRTGSPERSVYRQAQIAAINAFHHKTGGVRGPLGFPLTQVVFTGLTAARRYAGGEVALQAGEAQGKRRGAVRIIYVGFRCLEESDHDQGTGSDEPYFLIGVVAPNGSTVKRFAYEDINTNSVRTGFSPVATAGIDGGEDNFTPPVVLGVVAMEHDHGSKDEAEAKVRKVLEEAEKEIDEAAQTIGPLLGVPVGNHVMPDWMRKIVIGRLPEWGVALLGMGDDHIGANSQVLFDFTPDLLEWRAPAVIGKHGDNDYNVVLTVDGGDAGKYKLFFLVDLFNLDVEIRPRG